jgi:diguanylate cyclase (GGDEF)-like protein
MVRGRGRFTLFVAIVVAFLLLHGLLMELFPGHAVGVSYPFLICAPILALAASIRQTYLNASRARLPWLLLSLGLFLWTVGMLLSAWEELFQGVPQTIVAVSDLVYFLYGVPILLAISSPTHGPRTRVFFWLDTGQVVLTALLVYVTLFSVMPFASGPIQPIPVNLLANVYNIEDLVLACGATLRLLAQPVGGEDRRSFQLLCWFLWVYAGCAWAYNAASVHYNRHGLFDILVDVPFLILASLSALPPPDSAHIDLPNQPSALGTLIDIASPIFYTFALFGLGIALLRPHFRIGIGALIVALLVYCVRTTVLQSQFQRAERALQHARDRLREMSLRDSLTNIANRRCFDEILDAEWHRAGRSQQPLSLLLADIDFFKNLNDRHGHRHGYECLVQIANALKAALPRSGDVLARYGGEEFAVILPETDAIGARSVASRMQQAVADLKLVNPTALGEHVTLSVGIATYQFPEQGTSEALIEVSDRALYRAKARGRNRVELGALAELQTPA